MLNKHNYIRDVEYCADCGETAGHPNHFPGAEDKKKDGFWGAAAFFVLTFAAVTVTVHDIWVSRWDRATYFLVTTLELLRLWGKYESRRE